MKLRAKILSYTLPLILIPFLLTSLAVYYFVIRANRIQIEEEKKQTLNEMLVSFRKEMDFARHDVKLLSDVSTISEFLKNKNENETLENQAKTFLEVFFKKNPYYLQLSLLDENGKERIKFSKIPEEKELQKLTGEDYFRRTLISGSFQTPVKEIQPGKFATIFTKSINNEEDGKFLGMILLVLNTQSFEREMRPLLKRGLATLLFDDRGVILASAFDSGLDRKIALSVDFSQEATELLSKSLFESQRKKISSGDHEFIFSALPAESFTQIDTIAMQSGSNWFLGVFERASGDFVPVSFQIFFYDAFLAVCLVLWMSSKTAKRITDPLEKLVRRRN